MGGAVMFANMSIIIAFLIGLALLYLAHRYARKTHSVAVWIDEGRQTKPFYSKQYNLAGKPDAIMRKGSTLYSVEYKSRKQNIYDSDVIQLKAASLLAREQGYNVRYGLIKTQEKEYRVDFGTNQALYKELKQYIALASDIDRGKDVPAKPHKFKCQYCAYKSDCGYRHSSS